MREASKLLERFTGRRSYKLRANAMMKLLVFIVTTLAIAPSFAQETTTEVVENDLNKKINDLEQIQAENSELIKRLLKDQYKDQLSRGYIEIKLGRASIEPKDIEDENNETFNDLNSASWQSFEYANIIDFEIGKTILTDFGSKHEFGIGYQHLRSKRLEASYIDSDTNKRIRVFETIIGHTLFARYAHLFKTGYSDKAYFGPGVTIGYAPVTKLQIEFESGDEGIQVNGENTSMLIEIFGKGKFEFTRYFQAVFNIGYRLQRADNIRLNAAELVTLKTKTDIDVSGFYGSLGIAVSF
jgi:uncharacterized protein (UPF0335 family)